MKTVIMIAALVAAGVANAAPVQIVVDFKDDATMDQIHAAEKLTGLHFVDNSALWESDKLMVATVDDVRVQEYLDKLNDDSDVEVAELSQTYSIPEQDNAGSTSYDDGVGAYGGADFDVPNDAKYDLQRWHFGMIGLEQAWKKTAGEGVVVAVLDTGTSDGKDKAFPRVGDLAQTEILPGYNFVDNNDRANDGHGHGSHCSSTIAESTNNKIGGAGIAFKAKILPVKVLSDSGSGSTADIAEGIRWAADHGANVISMSLGGGGRSSVMENAIQYAKKKNVVIVAAAGNDPSENTHYPAAYDGVLAISAVGPGGEPGSKSASDPKTAKLATYSSYGAAGGAKGIFVAAPGGDRRVFGDAGGVWQSTVAETNGRPDPSKWAFRSFNGTSMACPHVAGAAASVISELMAKNGGKYKADDVESILAKSATKRDDKKKFGAGILNVGAAVSLADEQSSSHPVRWLLGAGAFGVGILFLRRRK